jgi:hypothetical protein
VSKNFNSIKDLEKYLNKQMADVLQNEVAEKVKDVEQESIDRTVYGGYQPTSPDSEPWVYERRRDDGGLRDRRNMEETVVHTSNGVELSIENTTTGSDDDFEIADLVEYGDGANGKEYSFKSNRDNTAYQYLRGRPFTKETVEELERTGEHVDEMRKGLRRKGLDVE